MNVLLYDRLRRLAERGFTQFGMSTSASSLVDPVQKLGDINVEYLDTRTLTREFDLRQDSRFFAAVYRTVRQLRPDITLTYGPKPGAIARPAARLAGSRVVHMHWGNVYDDNSPFAKKVIYQSIDHFGAAFSSDVCVENSADFARLDSWLSPWTKFHLLGNATDTKDMFSPDVVDQADVNRLRTQLVGDGKLLVILVGRVVVDKGYREFIAAARNLEQSRPELGLRYALVGREDDARGLAYSLSSGDRAQLSQRLTQLGFVDHSQLPALYAASDIVCLPSYREGFPKSLVEAASMGKPIIATDIAGCREVVQHDRNGLLIPPRDSTALAESIAKLAADADLRTQFGARSRAVAVEQFGGDALVERLLHVLGSPG